MQKEANHKLRLGVNIDHVATLRNARGGTHPDPVEAAQLAAKAGADGITAHLREDRRHIRDIDIKRLMAELDKSLNLPLNLEMAATEEMLGIALRTKPHACCLVPERRQELTTEGGLDVAAQQQTLTPFIARLREVGIRVSLFIDPARAQIEAAHACQAEVVELHTGRFCEAHIDKRKQEAEAELARLQQAATQAHAIGLEVHAGHGLDFATVKPVAAIAQIVELNIGHFLIGASISMGLMEAVRKMRHYMDEARIDEARMDESHRDKERPMSQSEKLGDNT